LKSKWPCDDDDINNADDAFAAASELDTNGNWRASINAFRIAAERWPEHTDQIENCIAGVQRKIDATE